MASAQNFLRRGTKHASSPWNLRADRVMRVGRCDVAGDEQAQGIGQRMPLLALHALMRVVFVDASGLLDSHHTLTVHNGPIGVGVPTHALALGRVKRGVEQAPPAGHSSAHRGRAVLPDTVSRAHAMARFGASKAPRNARMEGIRPSAPVRNILACEQVTLPASFSWRVSRLASRCRCSIRRG